MDNSIIPTNSVNLPETLNVTLSHINGIMQAFNLPRDIIASDDEIVYAWRELPREILRIPEELRDELIVRMCVATSVGLFDGAINYIWNAVILTLKRKVKNFGLALVGQTLGKSFDESDYVCVNELGDLIKPRTLSDNFKRIIKENKIRNLRLYDCRHTAASLMLKNGINMKQIQLMLGHSDYATTANIYSHLDFTDKISATETMKDIIFGES